MFKQEVNLVIPMAGRGQRFVDAGISTIKPLIRAHDKYLFEWAIQSFNNLPAQFNIHLYCIVLTEHIHEQQIDKIITKTYPNATIIPLAQTTRGQAETVLLAKPFLKPELPLLIFNNDTYFQSKTLPTILTTATHDGAILCFESNLPKYSYAQTDTTGKVLKTTEKVVISPYASNGLYYFKNGYDFFNTVESMISAQDTHAGEYYVIPVYNKLITQKKQIQMVLVEKNYIFGTPEELELFQKASL